MSANPNRTPAVATRPRRIVPPAVFQPRGLALEQLAAAAAPNPLLVDHGGKVLGAVEVAPIYWGAAWSNTLAQTAQDLDAFFDFILTSSLMDLMAEYSTASTAIGHGRRIGSVTISDNEPGGASSQISDAEIQQALQAWIASGAVRPTTANTLYFIYLPPNVVSTDGGSQSCTDYCGYHNHIGGTVFYAVIPYADCQECRYPGPILDTLTEVSGHELCEAITDPALDTWWDPQPHDQDGAGDEIGDICNRQAVRLGAYLVQTEWSNRKGACSIAP